MSLINREELLTAIMDDGGIQYPRWWYVDKVKTAPEVDTVEVVRCKDCKWWNEFYKECHSPNWVTKTDGPFVIPTRFFCGWGERREDGRPD